MLRYLKPAVARNQGFIAFLIKREVLRKPVGAGPSARPLLRALPPSSGFLARTSSNGKPLQVALPDDSARTLPPLSLLPAGRRQGQAIKSFTELNNFAVNCNRYNCRVFSKLL
jgi:hypothetical protein